MLGEGLQKIWAALLFLQHVFLPFWTLKCSMRGCSSVSGTVVNLFWSTPYSTILPKQTRLEHPSAKDTGICKAPFLPDLSSEDFTLCQSCTRHGFALAALGCFCFCGWF